MSNMNYMDLSSDKVIAYADADTRQKFIKKTYFHLALAIALFAMLETIMLQMGLGHLAVSVLSTIGVFGWLGVLLAYGFISHIVHKKAHESVTGQQQYIWWGIGIFAEAIIFLPIIAMALYYTPADANVLSHAAVITIAMVVGLTAVVLFTGKDFSFLRPALTIGFFVAIGLIIASALFGFTLGLVFSGAMIIFASAAILYETSKIQHHYHESQHVGASLALFASVGLLFWYVIQFVMAFTGGE
ncbi:Bax inhibitor-1/YccA family protein [Ostreibacterium oceani]|nr:Bax inhibitor-1 family protein [Ostreibacterium oceani]